MPFFIIVSSSCSDKANTLRLGWTCFGILNPLKSVFAVIDIAWSPPHPSPNLATFDFSFYIFILDSNNGICHFPVFQLVVVPTLALGILLLSQFFLAVKMTIR